MKPAHNKSEKLSWISGRLMTAQNIPWILLVFILVMVGSVLTWNAQVRYQEFAAYQQRLMESSANGTAAQLEVFIGELQRSISLFAKSEQKRFEMLVADPEDEETFEQLDAVARQYFPEAFALTIADSNGVPLLTDFDGLTGERCLSDMRTFATNREHSKIYVHPHPTTYHFDIMVDRVNSDQSTGVFFVSFKTDILSTILEHGQLPGHRLLLLKRDLPGLIEITAGGTRIDLHREFHLSPEEMNRVGYSIHVKGTFWDVVDLPDADLYGDMHDAIWRGTWLIMLVFVIVTALMVWLYQRSQAKQREIEHAYNHDDVTGLPNRHFLMERLMSMVENGRQARVPFTLMLIDLGRFQRLKGTFFEHRPNDALIQGVAERLKKVLTEAEMVSRIGNNEYAILLSGQDIDLIEESSHKVITALKQPFGVQNDVTLPNPCAGYARFPEDADDVYALIRYAGKQIYAARQGGA